VLKRLHYPLDVSLMCVRALVQMVSANRLQCPADRIRSWRWGS
jgi:hypothetical protein